MLTVVHDMLVSTIPSLVMGPRKYRACTLINFYNGRYTNQETASNLGKAIFAACFSIFVLGVSCW